MNKHFCGNGSGLNESSAGMEEKLDGMDGNRSVVRVGMAVSVPMQVCSLEHTATHQTYCLLDRCEVFRVLTCVIYSSVVSNFLPRHMMLSFVLSFAWDVVHSLLVGSFKP